MADSSDIVYFNALLVNDTDGYKAATYQAQLNQPVLDKAGTYYASIIRFSFPGATMPILNFELLDEAKSDTEGIYGISLSFDDGKTVTNVSQNLEWQDFDLVNTNPTRKWIYSYRWMINMMNTALATAFSSLVSATSITTPTAPPWFEYDPTTKLITLYAEETYNGNMSQNPVYIYVNVYLQKLLQGMGWLSNFPRSNVTQANNQDYRMDLRNYGSNLLSSKDDPNGTTLSNVYAITQEYATLYNWNSFETLQILSYNMPVNNEVTPVEQDTGAFSTIPILQDFLLPVSDGPDSRSIIQYNATGQYRWLTLSSDQPLNQINLNVNFTDTYGNTYPLILQPRSSGSIKLAFYRKKLLDPRVGVFM